MIFNISDRFLICRPVTDIIGGWGGGMGDHDAKNELFQNMVMLHIKLKGMKHTIKC